MNIFIKPQNINYAICRKAGKLRNTAPNNSTSNERNSNLLNLKCENQIIFYLMQ